ncbi:hypothetical protein CHS0354_007609 [Potamilus streckersoni]|uniref:Mab-21-like HhH/H2TH-like domain-containing protein n=1 Tax=Potamilus streckersoni TaxID=2493646 RepID=A0AAE0T3T1_9BIVA|nr:hypothetical protein CHS0354_007609 [Potamilus streckersoni]
MLKFIKNAFIHVDVKEHLLTSYHCKTCMFYMIQNTSASLWHPNNLMLCIDLCLRQLLSWVECNNCPNYFLPEENMLLGRNLGPVQRHVAGVLHDLLKQKGRYIRRIPYESIGKNVLRVCQSLPMELDEPNRKTLITTFAHFAHVVEFVCIAVANHNISNLDLFKLSHGIRQEAANLVQLLYCSSLGNQLASQCLEQEIPDQEKLILAKEFLLLGSSSDVACGNLKLAALYLTQNNLDKMEEVLNHVDDNFTSIFADEDESTFSRIVHDEVSLAKLAQDYFALEVFHGPSDIHSIPKVLVLKMFRSTGSVWGVDRLVAHWIPIAQISPRLYLYFLQFQCFHLQVRVAQTLIALYNMMLMSKSTLQSLDTLLARTADVPWRPDFHCSALMYLTTATTPLNLLAYCLKQGKNGWNSGTKIGAPEDILRRK